MKNNRNINILKSNMPLIFVSIGIVLILLSLNICIDSNNEGIFNLLTNEHSAISKLVINEIMTDNEGVNIDEDGNLYDWIELYNGTGKDIDLANYGLSDREDGSVKWIFPDVTIKSNSYLIVYLKGEKHDGLYANFSLKKEGGELVSLKSSNGKTIDAVNTFELSKNNSMYRDSNGNWLVTNEATPGFENSKEGRELFLNPNREMAKYDDIGLSEVLPSNEGNIIIDDNNFYGYVEITNNSESAINLNKYYLSNEEDILYKWRFPDYELQPNNSYLVYMSGKDSSNSTSFHLKHRNGTVILSSSKGVVDKLEYSDLTNGVSYIKMDNKWYQSGNISPGYPNTTLGKIEFQKNFDVIKNDLIINEVMSSNSRYLVQNGNQYYDWIELYNNSDHDILLSEYTLTTNKDDKYMFKLPEENLEPGEYYILMASGDTSLSNSKYNHTNFKLSSGNGLILFKDEKVIDSLFMYDIPKGSSYGRGEEYGHFFYSKPTPGEENGINGVRELSYNPVFSTPGGVYNDVSSLELSLSGNGDIYYTLDGTNPNTNSIKYKEPIILTKTTIVKAISYESDKENSDVIVNSYIINENHNIPVVSLTLKEQDLNYLNNYPYSDRLVSSHIELFEENSSFSMPCGVKIFGGESRSYSKKSFSIKFSKEFSNSHLYYKVFDNKDLVEFNDLVLRSGSQDMNSSMIRDEFVSTMLVNYGTIIAQAAKPVVLYINGNYWGVYFIREKINEEYIENNYNVSGTTNIVDYHLNTETGSSSAFKDIKEFMLNNSLEIDDNYNYVKEKIDIDALIDYYVVEFIISNTDLHNIKFYNNSELDNGKIKIILYDSDYSLIANYGSSYFNFLMYPSWLGNPPDSTYLRELLKNKDFRKRFVERVAYYMKNVWTEDNIIKTYNYFYDAIEPEMERNSQRWDYGYYEWQYNIEKLKDKALDRIKTIPRATRDYFNLTQEEFNGLFS